MIQKISPSVAEALQDIADGSTILISGFGGAGLPIYLLDALVEQGAKNLTLVSNNAGNQGVGIAKLIAAGQVRKMVCSFPRQPESGAFDDLYRAGKIELELVPQGTLAERIRAGGAGIGGRLLCGAGSGLRPSRPSPGAPPGGASWASKGVPAANRAAVAMTASARRGMRRILRT